MTDLNITEIKNPQKSIFVSANAGSGKTFILVGRVLSLLLAGEEIDKILCISFTEAAASEVKDRIISRLHLWHQGFVEEDILLTTEEEKRKAKSLYKDIILLGKMPKIMTFHAFCMQIVSLFSLESNLLYKPSILSNILVKSLHKKIFKKLIINPSTKEVVEEMKNFFSLHSLQDRIVNQLIYKQESSFFYNQNLEQKVCSYLGILQNQVCLKWWEKDFITNLSKNKIQDLFLKLEGVKLSKAQQCKIDKIRNFYHTGSINDLKSVVFTSTNDIAKRPPFPSNLLPLPEWEYIVDYCVNKFELQNKILTAKATFTLIKLSKEVFSLYKEEKEKLEVLDFNDLILIAHKALNTHERDFILFKLDGGLNHILVDEAQDTNFTQWGILNSILEEFFAGEGATRGNKSLFIVGDEKQSIYGFQGSNPKALEYTFAKYKDNLTKLYLKKSYRTTKPILDFVDSIFKQAPYHNYVSNQEYSEHESHYTNAFGRVEICELPEFDEEKTSPKQDIFKMPWEEDEEQTLKHALSQQITQKICDILKEGRVILNKNRKVKPCDFMLLVKSRDAELFDFLKKDLSLHNIGVSFSSKVTLSESSILRDFISLLKYLLNKENSLALAIVLRSPMFEFGDTDLFEVFSQNNHSIIDQISNLNYLLEGDVESFFTQAFIMFESNYSPIELREFAYIFNLIQDYKSTVSQPNLEGFVIFFEALCRDNIEFKFNLPECENSVKIQTVHSAKGLENPIVFILNATEALSKQESKEVFAYDEKEDIFLLAKSSFQCLEWKKIHKEKLSSEYAEYIRLFYVALTRAMEEIYIFPKKISNNKVNQEFESWYDIAKKTLPSLKLCKNDIIFECTKQTKTETAKSTLLTDLTVKTKKTQIKTATESLQKTKYLQIGSAIHEMLEHDTINDIKYFIRKFDLLNQDIISGLIRQALKIKQKFSFLFAKNALSEVDIMHIEDDYFFKGKIDKLIVEDAVCIYDFKYQKNFKLKDKIIHQLSVYKKEVQKIYPNKKIQCFVLWILEGELEEIIYPSFQKGESSPQLF